MLRTLVAVVALALFVGCGSDGSSPAPAPAPSPDPNANPTTAAPSNPAPEPSNPSPSPPSPPAPAPPPPAPEPERFVTVERLDSNAECDALVPAKVPAPVTVKVDPAPEARGCGGAVAEGTGHVAAAVAFTPRGTEYQVFGPDGRAEQRFTLTGELWPQPEGWQGVRATTSGTPTTIDVLTFFADGSPRRVEQPRPPGFGPRLSTVAPDPGGGSLVVLWGPTGSGAGASCLGEARRFDATGAPAGTPGPTGCDVTAAGVSRGTEALVLESGAGGTLLRWLRADGTPAREPAEDPSRIFGRLEPLLDGALAVREGGSWTRRCPHLGTASEPAPAWLAARAGQSFRFTRGNAGYAFFPPQGRTSSDCTQAVELVAPSGRRCARLTFTRDGNACVTGVIDQGWDGTVVQQTGTGACGWRFWPGLLAGP